MMAWTTIDPSMFGYDITPPPVLSREDYLRQSDSWRQTLQDAYCRHSLSEDPAAQLSAAGYAEALERYGFDVPVCDAATFEDISLAQATPEQLPVENPIPPEAAHDYWWPEVESPGIVIPGATTETATGSGAGLIGAVIGLGGLALAAAFLGGRK